jgi:RNA polymerase sigma-70 factor (ECF subfamily)
LLDDVAAGPEARYEARESIALSFVAGLQNLPPQQRAVLVLRDVLGFSIPETAEVLGSTTTSVNSALQRARAGFKPGRDLERIAVPRSPEEAEVVSRFVEAFESGDARRLVALLTEDVRLTMPPDQVGYEGPLAIVEFLRLQGIWDDKIRLVATRANGQPAFGYYRPDPNAPIWRANGLVVITVHGRQVSAITRFGDTGLLARFGLPRTLSTA